MAAVFVILKSRADGEEQLFELCQKDTSETFDQAIRQTYQLHPDSSYTLQKVAMIAGQERYVNALLGNVIDAVHQRIRDLHENMLIGSQRPDEPLSGEMQWYIQLPKAVSPTTTHASGCSGTQQHQRENSSGTSLKEASGSTRTAGGRGVTQDWREAMKKEIRSNIPKQKDPATGRMLYILKTVQLVPDPSRPEGRYCRCIRQLARCTT
jgi:hypothetical protein